MRDGVDVADARAREGEARLIRRGEHRLPRPEVPAVAADLRQVAEDSRDRPLGHAPRLGGVVEAADIGLDRVRQGVHARLRRHVRRQARRERRVEHRRLRNQAEVIDGVFVWFPVDTVCDDSCRRCLRTGSGCRRHGKQLWKFPTDFQEAPHRRNRLFRTADAGTDQLCCIENGSAADGEDSLSLNLLIKTETLFHALNLRIRGDFGENGDGNVFFFTAIQQRRQCSAADKAGGSHQENPGDPAFPA